MKYSQYKKLTPEQKEEYNYRFKDNNISLSGTWIYIVIITLIFSIGILVSFIHIKIIEETALQQKDFMIEIFKICKIMFWVWIINIIIEIISYIVIKIQELKWKKQNCIQNQ